MYWKKLRIIMDKIKEDYNGLQINAYVINLPERIDRRKHIETQFFNRPEFLLHFIEAETDKIGAVGTCSRKYF